MGLGVSGTCVRLKRILDLASLNKENAKTDTAKSNPKI